MSVSVLTEHANSHSALVDLPLRAEQARPMGQLAPVLATPATALAFAAGVAVGHQVGQAHAAGVAAAGGNDQER